MAFISHISFSVSDFQRSLEFYDAVMSTLGHHRTYTGESGAGWGRCPGRNTETATNSKLNFLFDPV